MPGVRNRSIQKHPIHAQFHRSSHIAGCAYARVHNDWVVGIAVFQILQTDADVVGVKNALSRTDRAACGHHAGRTEIFEAFGDDGIVAGIDEYRKAIGHQSGCGLQRAHRIW